MIIIRHNNTCAKVLVFDPGTGSNGESMEPEIVSRKNKQDNFHVIERKEIEKKVISVAHYGRGRRKVPPQGRRSGPHRGGRTSLSGSR